MTQLMLILAERIKPLDEVNRLELYASSAATLLI